jgi:hypothetical protein
LLRSELVAIGTNTVNLRDDGPTKLRRIPSDPRPVRRTIPESAERGINLVYANCDARRGAPECLFDIIANSCQLGWLVSSYRE